MKYFLAFVIAVLFATGGAFGGMYYIEGQYAEKFHAMTGLTVEEFDKSYAGCVVATGELCNLYGGFAPLSRFADGRDGQPPIKDGRML